MAPQAQDFGNIEQLNRRFRPALMAYFLRRLHNHAAVVFDGETHLSLIRAAITRGLRFALPL